MLRSTLCVVKCPEVMDVNGHVVRFSTITVLGSGFASSVAGFQD